MGSTVLSWPSRYAGGFRPGPHSATAGSFGVMLRLILALLAIWLVLTVLGFVIKGLLWLAVIGIILFAVTAVWGYVKRETFNRG